MTSKIKRTAAIAALTLTSALALAACSGGSGLDGEYYSNSGQLVIDGTAVAFYSFECSETENGVAVIAPNPDAEGELTEDGTQVLWDTDEEQFLEDDSIDGVFAVTSAGSGDTISLNDYQYSVMDKDEALNGFSRLC